VDALTYEEREEEVEEEVKLLIWLMEFLLQMFTMVVLVFKWRIMQFDKWK